MEERSNNTGLVVVVTLLVVAVLGLIGFIVYDKVINKTNEPNLEENNNNNNNESNSNQTDDEAGNVKELSINDSLITSLKYPMNVFKVNEKKHWDYKNITIDSLGRKNMMYTASFNMSSRDSEIEGQSVSIYSATQIESNFKSIFGPDVKYYNEDIGEIECGKISVYNKTDNTYIAYSGCGGDSLGYIDRIAKTYKAEQAGDYIYVYDYVQSVVVEPSDNWPEEDETIVYLLDKNDNKTTTINFANYESTIESMMNKGEVDTYKWTFKRQSDGNYYFYSGAWEN